MVDLFANIDRRFYIVILLFQIQNQEADEWVALYLGKLKLIMLRNRNIFKQSGSAPSLVSIYTDACICFFQRQKCSYCVFK